jgi:hypothetical protein
MKAFITLFTFLLFTGLLSAQAPPEGINYQAVALDPNGKEIVGVDSKGQVIPERAISVRFSIISGTATGQEEYIETHKTNTDAYGMFSLVIGQGEQSGGAVSGFANINWASGAHFLKVEIDPAGGVNYLTMGVQQMMSVPYALYAKSSGSGGGTQGPKGDDGLSAYQVWLSLGNTGSEADFLASLSGPAGAPGPQGPQGDPGPQGAQGVQGPQGAGLTIIGSVTNSGNLPVPYTGNTGDGYIDQSTGNLWIWDGSQWNNVGNIVGPAGPQGESAYQVWLSQGNSGTVNDFLSSLTGPAGPAGAAGAQGPAGPAGAQGPQGNAGPTGPTGPAGAAGPQGPQGPAGSNGIGITWLGTFAAAPANPTLNNAYYNSTLGSSFIWNGSSWQTLAQDGTGGSGGNTLNQAYNQGGPGAGRTITANSGSVQINASGASTAGLEVNTSVNNSSGVFTTHTGTGVSFRAESTNPSNNFSAIQSVTNSFDANTSAIIGSNSGGGFGVAAQLPQTATGFAAVFGNNLRTNGGSGVDGGGFQGVSGQSFVTGGSGVFGLHNNPGVGANPNGNPAVVNAGITGLGFYGGLGQTQYRAGVGLFGLNVDQIGSLADDATGVIGNGGFVGVLGNSQDPTGYGVASLTSVLALGDLMALGVKSFAIDHPMDPANKMLRHSAMESNEVLNVYRGNVVCDANGVATVQLPAYFEAINVNCSYILTPVGQAAPDLHVQSEINANQFVIAGGKPGMKVSWQVTAERNDIYMQQNPFASESLKPQRKQGLYFYPQGYGQPETKRYLNNNFVNSILPLNGAKTEQTELKIQK